MPNTPTRALGANRLGRLICALSTLLPTTLVAATCSVPTPGHPTLGAALRDAACTTVNVAAGTYRENLVVARGVDIAGGGSATTFVAGAVETVGATTYVTLSGLAIDGTGAGVAGCWQSLLAANSGARLSTTSDVRVTNSGVPAGPCRLFADGFESSGVLAWSAASP